MISELTEAAGNETTGTLVDRLLAGQRSLSAVERFSQRHTDAKGPAKEKYYRDLIPLSRPQEGEQYSFEVDLDACTSCKACVTACHSLNGLDDTESWRDIGILYGENDQGPWQQTVTTACHHCNDPGCANGCPVLAYEKDEDTGIVRHLDDQCIGCQYCVFKCPYDVPKYNQSLGIVRKCDMCHDRLSEGEAPACVQACPNGAIKIKIVRQDEVVARAERELQMLPGAFDSRYTQPSTVYHSKKTIPSDARPSDERDLTPEHAHMPLVWMLTLTQLAAGLWLGSLLFGGPGDPVTRTWWWSAAALLSAVGVGASVLHLGRPLQAWRAFLGWRKSWLSREILAFGGWVPLGLTALGLLLLQLPFTKIAGFSATALGLVGVFTSVMVYADTKRSYWNLERTGLRFYGTVGLAAAASGWVAGSSLAAGVLVAATLGKLSWEWLRTVHPARQPGWDPEIRSARVLLGPLRRMGMARLSASLLGGILLPLLSLALALPSLAWAGIFLVSVGEWLERYLFFSAVTPPRMNGVV
ncbi:MAG: DmsC/YnfH family molybdoenzyme membrane anchor subunit [Verrucomicrobiota bacterium]